ncbi:MAG TPA: penicillin-binding transpeptidase domain-containing protein [Pyrinomonadaceae bacterium]|nr:penicillin-binding transpeptidase domain-containing protein [Pyrinomonadaceae bacterium]
MFFSAEKLYFNRVFGLFLILFLVALAAGVQAQARRFAPKQDKNKVEKQDRNQDKNSKKTTGNSKAELAREAENRKQAKERERAAESRRDEARAAELARRQALLEERRRREQAAREAEARRRALERGLKTETQENIGNDETEGEDLEVRRAAVNALGGHAGTVVVLEPQTGKVLSIVNQEWAIRRGFKPCSTIKLVTGVAGLNEKVIASTGEIRTRSFPMDLTDALAFSNNSYFQRAGVTGIGNEKMISYARALGLGEQTGINARGENAGRLPFGNSNPRIYSHGDDFEVTPLQLAVMVSAISNGGKLVVPQIPRTKIEKANFRGLMRRQINFSAQNLQAVLPGMIGAVTYGTARRSNGAELNVAGKTGSCIGQGSWVGLFASVAPAVNPQIAVVVITRGQGERGKYASAIAGKIYQAISYRFGSRQRDLIARNAPLEMIKPQPKINARSSALLDDEEGEDSDEGDTSGVKVKKEETRVAQQQRQTSTTPVRQKPELKQADRSTFTPVVIEYKRDGAEVPDNSLPTRPRIVKTNK